jgi:hypothetical protein
MTTNLSDGRGGKLKGGSGHSRGAGLSVIAAGEINETLTLSLVYAFFGVEYKGGALRPDSPGLEVKDDLSVTSNGVEICADVDLHRAGRLAFHLLQAFDEFQGSRRTYTNGILVRKASLDNFSERISSLYGWYEIDARLTDYVTLTPFIGWRSTYAHVDNPQGDEEESSTNAWTHLISGGLKAGWRKDLLKVNLSAGINVRVSRDDLWGFAPRTTEPNLNHAGFNATLDRRVGAFGAGASYVIPGFGVVTGGWNGMFGSSTNAQTLSLGFVLPF